MKNAIALTDKELEQVNGGNWISDAWDATCNFCSEYKKEIIMTASMVAGAALCATGVGAAAGAGLIEVTAAEIVAAGMTGAGIGGGACIIATNEKKK